VQPGEEGDEGGVAADNEEEIHRAAADADKFFEVGSGQRGVDRGVEVYAPDVLGEK
jgi:hypothetical protein